MEIGDILILAVIAIAFAAALRRWIRHGGKCASCENCSGCGSCGSCRKKEK